MEAWLTLAPLSKRTRVMYRSIVGRAMGYLGVNEMHELRRIHLAMWRAEVVALPDLAPGTKCTYIGAVRSFLRWCRAYELTTIPAEAVAIALKFPRNYVVRPYETLADKEISSLLLAAQPGRDQTLIAVMVLAGLRVEEVEGLRVGDFGLHPTPFLYVRKGKGEKSRSVPIVGDLAWLLRLATRGKTRGDPIFCRWNRAKEPLSKAGMAQRVTQTARRAGIDKRVTPHSLRHTFATRSLEYSGDVVSLSKVLGHTDLRVTQRYVDHSIGLAQLSKIMPPMPAHG